MPTRATRGHGRTTPLARACGCPAPTPPTARARPNPYTPSAPTRLRHPAPSEALFDGLNRHTPEGLSLTARGPAAVSGTASTPTAGGTSRVSTHADIAARAGQAVDASLCSSSSGSYRWHPGEAAFGIGRARAPAKRAPSVERTTSVRRAVLLKQGVLVKHVPAARRTTLPGGRIGRTSGVARSGGGDCVSAAGWADRVAGGRGESWWLGGWCERRGLCWWVGGLVGRVRGMVRPGVLGA
ncbi:hypothetical protein LV79_005979 [Actinokineospora globicatena]|nr:hypothetical protein [Actinokineospora globicatena]